MKDSDIKAMADALRRSIKAINTAVRLQVPTLGTDSYTIVAEAEKALEAYDNHIQVDELSANAMLVHAYARGEARGGSIDWDDINRAWIQAREELGEARCMGIDAIYAED